MNLNGAACELLTKRENEIHPTVPPALRLRLMNALKSSLEAAEARIQASIECHPIPPITDPMGRHWSQPDRQSILIDATHAVMSRQTFESLAEYSCSTPTGVYVGKMWRQHRPYERQGICNTDRHPNLKPCDHWWLAWFGHHADPKFVSNNYRKILILDQ